MTNTNATHFRQNLFDYLNQAVLYNDVINVNTKNGNAILLSEEDYNGLLETVYLLSSRQTASELLDALQEPLAQGTPFDPKEEW